MVIFVNQTKNKLMDIFIHFGSKEARDKEGQGSCTS